MDTSLDRDDLIATLNDLIEISKDGERGYKAAADDVTEAQLKETFFDGARSCAEGARELQAQVSHLGGDPERRGSLSGALHRGWLDAKSAVTGRDALAVLEEVERGEDVAVRVYREALEKALPADVRLTVQRQFDGVMANHARAKALRDRYRHT